MSKPGTAENPLRVAIVGAGPSGFYASEHLLKREDVAIEVDLYDRLPTPFGLVRGGVAPDHPKIKSVTRMYDKTAAREGFRFFGNVHVGHDITAAELGSAYHAVIWSHGAETDRKLGIPGEELPGSHAATEFVGWYNGHPDFAELTFDLDCERAVVIGNGNVATDVARMLALTEEELRATDTADHAIPVLAKSKVREILILGRRGPAQASFTNPEVRELGELEIADIVIDPAQMELDPVSAAHLESDDADPTHRRNVEIFRQFSERPLSGKPRRVELRFLTSPVEIHGADRVEAITVERNALVERDDGRLAAEGTGETERIECGLVFRSVGYSGKPIEGLPFDERTGVIPNESGAVLNEDGSRFAPHYTAGWIKRGPSGVIGTNKKDALDTVNRLLADYEAGAIDGEALSADEARAMVDEAAPSHVTWEGWGRIDAAEVVAGEPHGRPRVKFVRPDEMVEKARG